MLAIKYPVSDATASAPLDGSAIRPRQALTIAIRSSNGEDESFVYPFDSHEPKAFARYELEQ